MRVNAYAGELRALAKQLREIALLPPAEAMLALGPLADYKAEDNALARLRVARTEAARAAVDRCDPPTQAELARQLGVSDVLVSRAVRGQSRR